MEPFRLLALLVIATAVVGILAGLSILIWEAARAARIRDANAEPIIRWRQLSGPGASFKDRLRIVDTPGTGITRFLPLFRAAIADPVDGTAFEQGETVVHCACGTNYHQHSWQWIGEKNQGKCVSCKRPGLVSSYVC